MSDQPQLTFAQHPLRLVHEEAAQLADAIRQAAEAARGNEAQLVMACDHLLADFAQRANLRWEPQGERRVVWREEGGRRRGRIDRLFDRVVVEYEAPGSLYPTNEAAKNRHALQQARGYLDALIQHEGWKSPSVAGVVTDGLRFIFCRYSAGQWVEEAPVEAGPASVARFLRLLLTFHRPPLLPDPLVQKFGAPSQVTVNTVRAFYDALNVPTHPLTNALFAQWQDFFADIAGLDPARLKDKKELMNFARRVLGREAVDPARLLFGLYTYSALLIKLLAVAAVTPFFDRQVGQVGQVGLPLADWATLEDDDLRARLREVESGEFFQRLGVRNFTEGDFFGWYADEWTPAVARQVKQLLSELSAYDPDAVEQAPERVRDLLKRLYHGLFPREVRHDLGEYYTPDWLAERLLAQVDGDLFGPPERGENRRRQAQRVARRLTTTRFLDPACGSGTFLVLIIRRLRQWARECGVLEREQLLPALLQNVVGFDLNPLAVISARANVLLAIADLLTAEIGSRPDGPDGIELPIYLADSIVLPGEGQGESLFETTPGVYELPLRGVGKKFLVPEALATREHLNTLARLLRRDVEEEVGADAFLRACEGELALPAQQWRRCEKPLRELYETLRQLHRDGRNGLWADIARNMFMPLFISPADCVVGNPPWVNWESLPQDYRDRSKGLWQKYGLFVHGGMDTILGKGAKDISTLLTYVTADLYLKPGGKLGFVITQSVFKTGAGQGFRRFQLGDGECLKVLAVDDFSALQPFEGATNRTAVFVLQKGQPTTYPVPYNVWRKAGRTSVPFTAALDEASPLLTHKRFHAEPVDARDPTSAWLTAARPALRAVQKVLGQSDYRARKGADAIGANAVYWLQVLRQNPDGTVQARNITEGAKREVQAGVHTLEPDLLYPLLRGREVKRWVANPDLDARFLITHFPGDRLNAIPLEAMESRYPRTFAYLRKHEPTLRQRRSQAVRRLMDQTAFYAMFAVGDYTFAPFKVAWREIASEFFCCVIGGEAQGKCIVPDHKLVFVACEDETEAHYLCAMLNSSVARLTVESYSISTQFAPSIMEYIRIPRFAPNNPTHRRLSELSRRAHAIAAGEAAGSLADVERAVDEGAAQVWGLTAEELAAVRRSLEEK